MTPTPDAESRLYRLAQRIRDMVPDADPRLQAYLSELVTEIEAQDRALADQSEALQKYEEVVQTLTQPANRIGTYVRAMDDGLAMVVQGDTEFVVTVNPEVAAESLMPGARVRLNEAYAIVAVVPTLPTGAAVRVAEVREDTLRVGADTQGEGGKFVLIGPQLGEYRINKGDEVRLDASGRIAVEHLPRAGTRDYFLEEVPRTPWEAIGGQEVAVDLIRETLEFPLLHPELYAQFDKKPVKGILLYGPPGCGKTLIGRAIAYNLAREYSERLGRPVQEVFLNISGPKILNMWLGETERMVREIFATARERAAEGHLVVVFIDEAESLLRTRSSGRYLNIANTVVPQFCAEMDGLVSLENVVIVLTSNRPDYIDPAILRPERINRKVKIERPTREGARDILALYLHDRLPLDPAEIEAHDGEACAREALLEWTISRLWRTETATEFLRVYRRDGRTDTLHWKDFVSGALLKSVVDRAKDSAIRRAVADGATKAGITKQDLDDALRDEYREGEIFPKNDGVDDWLRLLDIDPADVATVHSIRERLPSDSYRRTVL